MDITFTQHTEILAAGSRFGYQICTGLAVIAGGWLIRRDTADWSLNNIQRWSILLVALFGALIGSMIPGFFAGGFISEVAWTTPVTPKTVMGGLLMSFLLIAAYKKIFHNNADTSDAFARGAIAMMAIGRIGCIFQHCCYGKEASWGYDFGDGVNRIPVQIIESSGLLILLLLIHYFHIYNRYPGRRLFIVFAGYGLLRFFMEFLRQPISQELLGMGFYQWIAIGIGLVGIFELLKRSPEKKTAYDPV